MSRCPLASPIGKSCRTAGCRYRRDAAWKPVPPANPLTAGDGAVNDFGAFAAGQVLRLSAPGAGLLHYQDRGRGPAVLLGHGYLGDSALWEPQIQALSRQYRVIAPDLWGHGASGPLPPATQHLEDLAEHMLELMDALDIPEFAIVGLSAGTLWGAELALQAPERVRALVMIAPCPLAMPTDRLRDSVVPLGSILFGGAGAPGRWSRLDPATTLLMYGDTDALCTPPEMERMAALIGCEAVQVPDAGHLPGLDQPEFVNRCLLQWLERTLR